MNFGCRDFNFGDDEDTVVIAEIGVNHNGNPETARRMIDAAARAGADVAKFQAFRAEKEISRFAAKTPYQEETTTAAGSQLEMCKVLELSGPVLMSLKDYCADIGMPFLCAAFDFESLDFVVDELRVNSIKIPSSEITNVPFLQYVGAKRKGVILSTGASTLAEVGSAVETLLEAGCPDLVLLHCVSSYPAPHSQVNLRAMHTLRQAFGLPVGFSDHTIGNAAPIAATALGAVAVEKHFTLDRQMLGPDHRASIEPAELTQLVKDIRTARKVLGSFIKMPAPCELENRSLIRKSLVAASDLGRGVVLTREMIEIKRPEGGVVPSDIEKVIGRRLAKAVEADRPIRWSDFS